ncbi:hypothetical protein CR969_03580 [Candidatus Saccharibacteria bacterium]|nr:MAG: hypothetical protein CR969_03580 [Candidatus Saccharibacteria bacterium]
MRELLNNTPNRLRALAMIPITALALSSMAACESVDDKEHYPELEAASGIQVCDDARIRLAPSVANGPDNNIMHQVDLGNSKECVNIEADKVFYHDEEANGRWYGVPEKDLANGLKGTKLNIFSTKKAWINHVKATPFIYKDELNGLDTPEGFEVVEK